MKNKLLRNDLIWVLGILIGTIIFGNINILLVSQIKEIDIVDRIMMFPAGFCTTVVVFGFLLIIKDRYEGKN